MDHHGNPLDEPTTLDHHDLPPDTNGIPHRHPNTDNREAFGILVWAGVSGVVIGGGVLVWAYFKGG